MGQKTNQDTLIGLDKLIAETRSRLVVNPDFVALTALQKARAEIVGIKGAVPETVPVITLFSADYSDAPHPEEGMPRRISQLAAADKVLDGTGHPLPAADLMEGAIKEGAVLGGGKPLVSFTSSLSKSDKFKSVRWNGGYCWWFADRPLPERVSVPRIRRYRDAAE